MSLALVDGRHVMSPVAPMAAGAPPLFSPRGLTFLVRGCPRCRLLTPGSPLRGLMHDRDSKTVQAWAVLRVLLALGVGLLPTLGWAEDPAPVPDHAYVGFGDHWKSDRGFKRADDRCEEIQVAEHAFLTTWGDGWEYYTRGTGQSAVLSAIRKGIAILVRSAVASKPSPTPSKRIERS